jgi:hypothetical protein
MAATNPTAGLSDPSIIRTVEARLAQAAIIANGKPTVSGSELILPSTTVRATSTSIVTTTSANNDPGDIVTVYNAPQGGVYVSSIDQTVRQTVVNNPIAGVSSIIAGNNITITSSGANGTGNVTINTTVPSVGNIAVLNLDGNGSNILRGNGTWGPDANSSYGNSNVASLLTAFGSNTITTTGNVSVGNIIGNGQALTGIAGANVSGFVPNANVANTAFAVAGANVSGFVPNANVANTAFSVAAANVSGLGNIATININGNNQTWLAGNGVFANIVVPSVGNIATINLDGSNVLRGDGTFAADANSSYGNSNVATFLASYGSNTMTTTGNVSVGNIIGNGQALTGLAGANVSGFVPNANVANTAFAVAAANVSGLGNIATINLDGNVSNLLTGNGTYVAIPVVPTVGNIANINLDGSNSNVLYGNGVFAPAAGGSYGNSDVATFLASYGSNTITTTGNVSVGNIIGNGQALTGIAGANVSGFVPNANVANTAFAVAAANVSGLGNIATINLNGNTSQVLLGNGAFATIPSSSIISNGNSNVSIATANGNVTINAVGNATMTVTGTGANVTGTLTSTGKIGYASGSSVTQLTSRGTGVTINTLAGTIITTSVAMAASEIDTFSVTNSAVDPTSDIILAQIVSPNQGTYDCIANPAVIGGFNPGFFLNIVNISGFTTSDETITIRFMVIKAPNA